MFRWLLAALMLFLVTTGCTTPERKNIAVKHHTLTSDPCAEPVFIRTRIIIEEVDGKAVRDFAQVIKDIWYTQELFRDLNIHFVVVAFGVVKPDQDWYKYLYSDADQYPSCLNVYYCYHRPRDSGTTVGMGLFPWLQHRNGIVVHGADGTHRTFAHEIGHYLGLMHTFNREFPVGYDDFVDDTLSPDEYAKLKPGDSYRNYNNIMNYHDCDTNFVTQGQIERMRWFLLQERTSIHMRNVFGPEQEYSEPKPQPESQESGAVGASRDMR